MKLDSKGRCCGRRPISYLATTHQRAEKYCMDCCRSFAPDTGHQLENWAWTPTSTGVFKRVNK